MMTFNIFKIAVFSFSIIVFILIYSSYENYLEETFSLPKPLLSYNFDGNSNNSGVLNNNAMIVGVGRYGDGKIDEALEFDGKTKIVIPNKTEMNSKSFQSQCGLILHRTDHNHWQLNIPWMIIKDGACSCNLQEM